ncbi:hypothetical protein DFH29DRAFT_29713 [Suillus ampliporus]|nr:hypothetical protein DFH29DRAFT_29713 [Suillus ampliporus]
MKPAGDCQRRAAQLCADFLVEQHSIIHHKALLPTNVGVGEPLVCTGGAPYKQIRCLNKRRYVSHKATSLNCNRCELFYQSPHRVSCGEICCFQSSLGFTDRRSFAGHRHKPPMVFWSGFVSLSRPTEIWDHYLLQRSFVQSWRPKPDLPTHIANL